MAVGPGTGLMVGDGAEVAGIMVGIGTTAVGVEARAGVLRLGVSAGARGGVGSTPAQAAITHPRMSMVKSRRKCFLWLTAPFW